MAHLNALTLKFAKIKGGGEEVNYFGLKQLIPLASLYWRMDFVTS